MATKKMAIIATKGALDMAYPPLILASTAAALGWEVQVFFTFYGLQLLRKDLSGIAISPIGNPAMPMPVPMPVIVSVLPGIGLVEREKLLAAGVTNVNTLLGHPPDKLKDILGLDQAGVSTLLANTNALLGRG